MLLNLDLLYLVKHTNQCSVLIIQSGGGHCDSVLWLFYGAVKCHLYRYYTWALSSSLPQESIQVVMKGFRHWTCCSYQWDCSLMPLLTVNGSFTCVNRSSWLLYEGKSFRLPGWTWLVVVKKKKIPHSSWTCCRVRDDCLSRVSQRMNPHQSLWCCSEFSSVTSSFGFWRKFLKHCRWFPQRFSASSGDELKLCQCTIFSMDYIKVAPYDVSHLLYKALWNVILTVMCLGNFIRGSRTLICLLTSRNQVLLCKLCAPGFYFISFGWCVSYLWIYGDFFEWLSVKVQTLLFIVLLFLVWRLNRLLNREEWKVGQDKKKKMWMRVKVWRWQLHHIDAAFPKNETMLFHWSQHWSSQCLASTVFSVGAVCPFAPYYHHHVLNGVEYIRMKPWGHLVTRNKWHCQKN